WTEILMGSQVIVVLTEGDAKAAGVPKQKLAAEYAQSVGQTIQTYRQEHSWRFILNGTLKTIVATLALGLVLWIVRRMRFALRDRIEKQILTCERLELKSAWHISV